MKVLQQQWREIVVLTEDIDGVLQGLRNSLFLDISINKLVFSNEIKALVKIFRMLFLSKKSFEFVEGKHLIFYFPFNSASNFNNLINIYKKFDVSDKDILVIHSNKLEGKYFRHDRIIKEDFCRYIPVRQRLRLVFPSLIKLYRLNKSKLRFVKFMPIKYLFLILQVYINMKAARYLFRCEPIKKIISTSDFFPVDYALYKSAVDNGVETYIVQHGILGISHFPYTSKNIFVWNKFIANSLLKLGVDSQSVFISGMPASDDLFSKKSEIKSLNLSDLSLLIISDTQGAITYPDVYKSFSEFLDALIEANTGIKIIIKLHPAETDNFYRKYKNSISILPHNIDLRSALSQCDLAATIWSTAGLEAMALEKPTLILNVHESVQEYAWWPNFGGGRFIQNIEEFRQVLSIDVLKDIVEKQNQFVIDYYPNQGKSSEYIHNILFK